MDVQVVTGSPDELAQWFVNDLDRAVRAAPPHRPFTLAVPGGSVAEAFFPRLATSGLPWGRIHVFWADERAVAGDDPASNHALARRLWLAPAAVPDASIHRMPADRADAARATEEHAAELCALTGDPPILDYVLLGAGEDGHVASIFPGAGDALDDVVVAAVDDAPKPPARRMTLGLRTLAGARRVVVAAFGPAKRQVIDRALSGADARSPLARVLRLAADPVLLVDGNM